MIKCSFCKYENDISDDCDYWGCPREEVMDLDNCSTFKVKEGSLSIYEIIRWFDLERKKAIVDEDIYTENHFSWLLSRIRRNPVELRKLIILWHSETEQDLKDKVNESIKELKESGKA